MPISVFPLGTRRSPPGVQCLQFHAVTWDDPEENFWHFCNHGCTTKIHSRQGSVAMWQTIQTFLEGTPGIASEDELFQRFESVASEIGYPYYAFGALWGDPEAFADRPAPAVRLNYPEAWIAHYFAQGYDKIDPVVLMSPYALNSVTWDELRPYRPTFFDDAAAHGLTSGISIPLRAISGCYVLCFASGDERRIGATERNRMELLAHGFFAAYQRVRQLHRVDHGLSDNTVKVIRLSMAGLSVEEIAERLELTKAGVYWCIKDSKKRLKCSTQAQVYLKAIQLGIVAL
ncbi:hypothetical protein GBZ48_31580 [Azospirillum melinis]|uniref:HTH luxR-type domain-containing protein n=2 Tax=Azospirillum melinis TaxID=328839 RepID=A0ABX2KV50_9PROT|nr:hypothetical protein [Azospirillum melinis]